MFSMRNLGQEFTFLCLLEILPQNSSLLAIFGCFAAENLLIDHFATHVLAKSFLAFPDFGIFHLVHLNVLFGFIFETPDDSNLVTNFCQDTLLLVLVRESRTFTTLVRAFPDLSKSLEEAVNN
jgi:hypothetical protein